MTQVVTLNITKASSDLCRGLVGLEQQSSSSLEKSPHLDLIFPADRELAVAQGEDLVDGALSKKVVLQFLCNEARRQYIQEH